MTRGDWFAYEMDFQPLHWQRDYWDRESVTRMMIRRDWFAYEMDFQPLNWQRDYWDRESVTRLAM